MSKDILISNDSLSVKISTFGAELKSIKKNGKEKLWDGNPDVWSGQAPILFPICGGLKEDRYIYKDNEYTLKKHGFARQSEFTVESNDKNSATFLLKYDDDSLKCFPFEYELRIKYTITENSLNVDYIVKNIGKDTMCFSVGAHEAYACPEGIEEYTVIFDKNEDLNASVLNGNLLTDKIETIKKNAKELPLDYKYFAIDALVFLNLKSRKVSLKNNLTNECIDVCFDGADYLLLWTKPDAKYICIEPWCGVPDFEGSSYDITEKRGIIPLKSNDTYTYTHIISF